MRYFNIEQMREPRSMYVGSGKLDISELESKCKEITKQDALSLPRWGSGNIEVDEEGNWSYLFTNFDTSD